MQALLYIVGFFNLALFHVEVFPKSKHLLLITSFLVVWTEASRISTNRNQFKKMQKNKNTEGKKEGLGFILWKPRVLDMSWV